MQKYFKDTKYIAIIAIIIIMAITPYFILIQESFSTFSYKDFEYILENIVNIYVYNTILLSIGVFIGVSIIGFIGAYITTFYSFKYKSFLEIGLILPLAFPSFILGFIYAEWLGESGFIRLAIANSFDIPLNNIPDIMSTWGAVFIFSIAFYPYVYLVSKTFLENQSNVFLENAMLLSGSKRKIFLKLILPLARVPIVSAAIIALMESISDYGLVHYFGIDTMTTGIFRLWFGSENIQMAIYLCLILMLFVFFLLITDYLQKKDKRYHIDTKNHTPIKKSHLKGKKAFFVFLIAFIPVLLGFILPFAQLVYWSVISFEIYMLEGIWEIIANTLKVVAISAFVILLLSVILTSITKDANNKANSWKLYMQKSVILSYSIPGAILAIGIIVLFNYIEKNLLLNIVLVGSMLSLIYGYTIRFLGIGVNSMESQIIKIPSIFKEISTLLGVSSIKRWFRVDFFMLRNGLIATYILLFIEIIKELPLTIIIAPFNFTTLTTRVFELIQQGDFIEASFPALIIVLLSLMVVLLFNKFLFKRN